MAKNERTIRMTSHSLLRIFIPTETFSFAAKQPTNIQGYFPHKWKIHNFFRWYYDDHKKKLKQRPDFVQNKFPVSKFFACGHRRLMYEA